MNRVRASAAIVQEGSLYVLLFLLPFSNAAVEILFGFLLLGWTFQRLDPKTRRDTIWIHPKLRRLTAAIGLYLAICALSILVSSRPALSIRALFCKWSEYLLMCVIVADVAMWPRVMSRCARAMLCSFVFVAVEAASQLIMGHGLFRGYSISVYNRITGPYKNPIDLGTYLIVFLPIAIGYALGRRRLFIRGAVFALIIVAIVGLAGIDSIGPLLGLFGGLIVAIVVYWSIRRMGLIAITATILAICAWIWRAGLADRYITLSDIGVADRVVMWQAAIGMIRDRPILGHGLNTFMANYLDYWVGGERQPRYAHNCYLQVAAETGIVGLILFVWLLWELFARLVGSLRRIRDGDRMLLFGFLAGLIAFALHAGIDTDFYSLRQAALFWTLAGLAVGASAQSGSEVETRT